jgi:ribonuclease T2
MAARLGETLTAGQLRKAFEGDFGPGTGQAVSLHCSQDGRRRIIGELHIKLKQPLSETTRLQDALDLSSPARGNCDAGVVDRVGLN